MASNLNKNMKYIAFDPGVATGIAAWDKNIKLVKLNILRGFEALYKFLDEIEAQNPKPDVIIYEKYRVGHSYDKLVSGGTLSRIHGGKTVPTEQAIGNILRTANKIKARVISQEQSILAVAQLHSGIKLSKNHANSHHQSAYNHGYEWLLRQGLIKPRVLGK